jgi:hypothetical protein
MGTVQGLRVARLRLPPMAVMAVEPVATARSKEAVRARPAGVGPRTPRHRCGAAAQGGAEEGVDARAAHGKAGVRRF